MAARANWKGVLKIGEVACPVALFTASTTAERIAFHILNRKSGHRVHREYAGAETGERVEAKDQVKGYEIGSGDYIAFEPEEIAKAVPEADKTLEVFKPLCPATRSPTCISTVPITSRRARRQERRPSF
jgi:DNA end-binding protein Ku